MKSKSAYIQYFVIALLLSLIACGSSDDPSPNEIPKYNLVTPAYKYSITNWDDGWISTIKTDWVEVVKGNIKVLLHYPQAATSIGGDPQPIVNNAWDILVAPRYSNLSGYAVVSPSLDYERAYLGSGTVKENTTGQNVFVALFKKGSSGWIEFIAPNKNTFIAQFGLDPSTIDWSTNSEVWNPLRAMVNYNRFAVDAADIMSTGKWSNNFGANTFYYSMYTGLSTGMSTYSSTEEFTFTGDNTYHWEILATNSAGGSTTFAQAKSNGTFNLTDNWNINFSNIENTQRKYAVWYAAVKNGRILFIGGTPYNWTGQ